MTMILAIYLEKDPQKLNDIISAALGHVPWAATAITTEHWADDIAQQVLIGGEVTKVLAGAVRAHRDADADPDPDPDPDDETSTGGDHVR